MRILFASPFPPSPSAPAGGPQEAARLVRSLADTDQVRVLCLRAGGEHGAGDELRADGVTVEEIGRGPVRRSPSGRAARVPLVAAGWARARPRAVTALASRPFAGRLSEIVREWRPDIVHFEHVHVAQYMGAVGAARCVVRMLEPAAQASLEHGRRAPLAARPGALLDAAATARFERRILARADAVVVLTEDDRAALARSIPERTPVLVSGLSLVVPSAVGADPPPDCVTFAYVANFAHAPNVHAAELLARRVLPAVRARVPAARLLLVGDGSTELGIGGDAVDKTGRVESVAETLAAAAVVAMPLRTGGGMRVKVFEALALGKAVVATPLAVSGLPVTSGEQLLVAESDDELAAGIAGLLTDPARRASLGAAARRWAVAEAERDSAARDVRAYYAAVAEGSAAPG